MSSSKNEQIVFYLDDEPALLDIYSCIVSEWGYGVETSSNVINALKKLIHQEKTYHALLVDYNMPDMNGIDFLCIARRCHYFDAKKVILFSSVALNEDVQIELENKIPDHRSLIKCIQKDINSTQALQSHLI